MATAAASLNACSPDARVNSTPSDAIETDWRQAAIAQLLGWTQYAHCLSGQHNINVFASFSSAPIVERIISSSFPVCACALAPIFSIIRLARRVHGVARTIDDSIDFRFIRSSGSPFTNRIVSADCCSQCARLTSNWFALCRTTTDRARIYHFLIIGGDALHLNPSSCWVALCAVNERKQYKFSISNSEAETIGMCSFCQMWRVNCENV